MSDLIIPDKTIIAPIETLFRGIKHDYINITENDFELNTSFTLIDRSHKVSFYRPYVVGLECLSGEKFDINFRNAEEIVNSVIVNVNVGIDSILQLGRKELIRQAILRWKEEAIFCEFSIDVFARNGFTANGQPNKNNISHAIVDFNLESKNRSQKAEKYMSENDMIVYTSDPAFSKHPQIVFVQI